MSVVLLCAVLAGCAAPSPADVKADAVRRGDELSTREQHAEAARAYREAVAVDPHDGVVRLKLSKALRDSQAWAAGAQEGISAAGLLPDNLEAQLWAVSMHVSESQFTDALQRIAQLRGRYPDNAMLLVHAGNATAHLPDDTWGLYRLSEAIRYDHDYEWTRQTMRVKTWPTEDREAEALFRAAVERDPEDWDIRLALVSFLWAAGRSAEAEPMLRQLADERPDESLANVALGLDYLRVGRFAEAAKYLTVAQTGGEKVSVELADAYLALGQLDDARRSLEEDGSPDAALRLAEVERRQGRRDESQRLIETVLARNPAHPEAWRKKAELLLETGDAASALSAARTAVERAPDSAATHLVLAQAAAKVGETSLAFEQFSEVTRLDPGNRQVLREIAHFALATGRDQAAADFARRAVRNDPRDALARADLVTALIRLGELADAERELAPLVAGKAPSANVLVMAARIQTGRGQAAAARTAYLRALKADPSSFDALSELVALDIAAGRLADARARAGEALRAHPDSPAHLRLAARVALAESAPERAEAPARSALALAPADPANVLLLDDILGRMRRQPEALELLERAMTRNPAPVELQLALADRLAEAGRAAEARKRYETAVSQFPRSAMAATKLAAVYAHEGTQLDIALDLARQARQQLPRNALVSDTLGLVYIRRGLPVLGLPHIEDAVRAEPANAVYQYHLGLALLGKGDKLEARAALSRALSLDAGFAYASKARETLAALTP